MSGHLKKKLYRSLTYILWFLILLYGLSGECLFVFVCFLCFLAGFFWGWFSSGLLFILLSLDAYLYSNEKKKGCEFGLEELKKEIVITYCMKKVYFQ